MKHHFTKSLNLIAIFMVWGQNRVEIKYSTCLVAQSCPTICDPRDCSPPGSSVHGSLQARILEWIAISFSRASSQPEDPTRILSLMSPALQADSLPAEPSGKPNKI